jgi:tRNA dimethylallyltransferase
MKQVVFALSGPTGSGKTEWGIRLAQELDGAIIVSDSRTVYRTLDIGTNKVTYEHPTIPRETPIGPVYRILGIDHYGLDLRSPTEQFTAFDFKQYADSVIALLWQQQEIPILVGGTGLYIDAVMQGFQFPARARLSDEWQKRPIAELVQELQLWDPQTALTIDVHNRSRVERALAYAFATGRSFSEAQKKVQPSFTKAVFVIDPDREQLYKRLDRRIGEWLDAGLLDEVRRLEATGVGREYIKQLGFMYSFAHERIHGQITDEVLVSRLRTEIRAFTKRQMTWWRRHPDVIWVNRYADLLRSAKRILKEAR